MSSIRIIAAGAALTIAAGIGPTSARACDNIFIPCQPAGYHSSPIKPRTVMPRGQPVSWGMQLVPSYRVVAQTELVAAKSATRRLKKQRARNKRAVKAVAVVAKPAKAVAAVAKPAKAAAIAKPAKAVAAVAKPPIKTPAPAAVTSVLSAPVARSIAISVPPKPIDQPAQSGTRETGKESDPPVKLVAVVDAGEVNEVDLSAGPAETFVPMIASAMVEQSRDRENTPSATTFVANVLSMFGGALAAGVIYLTRSI